MSFSKFLLPALFSAFLLFIPSGAHAQEESHVAIRLLPDKTQVKGGDTITVGIDHTISPGWHTYWINPGDSGAAARISWSGMPGIEAAPIQWPVPKRLPMGPLTNFGYEEGVTLLQDITLPQNIPAEPLTLTATVDVLVCQEICIPETHTASFTLNGSEEAVPAAVEVARSKLPLDVGWTTTLRENNGTLVIDVATDQANLFKDAAGIELYPEQWGLIQNPENTSASINEGSLTLQHKRGDRVLSDIPPGNIVIAYQDAQGIRKAIRVAVVADEESTAAPVTALSTSTTQNNVSIVQAVLLALLGGLILNLMPCVFPVLSMKALSLVQLKDEEAAKARWHGIFYTLGILFSFALVAAILLSLKAGGAEIGWGFQLQNPMIVLGLAYLFFILGLNLSGYFEIDFGLSNIGTHLTEKAGLSGSFFTGVLATVVATPCTAPFMAAAVGFALTQSAGVSIMIFLALGFGLALPYLLLTLIPLLRHALPRPGAWMETFRQFLAFPMFASALWLVWVLSQQVDHLGIFSALLGFLAITFGFWLWKARPLTGTFRVIIMIVAALSFVYAISTMFTLHKGSAIAQPAAMKGETAEDFTQELLDQYIQSGHPVFVNMTAAWCITCKVNEKVALNIEGTRILFANTGIKYLKGDWTNQKPEITKFLETYGRSGVPIYVYYGPPAETDGKRPDPVVLPQILTPGIIEKTISGE